MTNTPQTPITDAQLRMLMSPLNSNRVASLKGLSYLEAYDVKATLIRMFGFGGFSAELIESEILRAEQVEQARDKSKMNWAVTAKATVRLTIHQTGAVYTEAAIAGSKQPDFTESADMAIKSAESDALKRAAIYLGTQFGLSLYNNGSTSEIVRTILAPGQEWRNGARYDEAEIERLKALAAGGAASSGVAHIEPADGASPEEQAQRMGNLDQAFSAKLQPLAGDKDE